MMCADYPQYYYYGPNYIRYDLDEAGEDKYKEYGLNKNEEHFSLFRDQYNKLGPFVINQYLFHYRIRSLKVKRRYYIRDIDDQCRVDIAEYDDYEETRLALDKCKVLINKTLDHGKNLYDDDFIVQLKEIMKTCGQDIG